MRGKWNIQGIEAHHVMRAGRSLDAKIREGGTYAPFRDSTTYDVIIGGKPYPPKAISALACEYANGKGPSPGEFGGLHEGSWHKRLQALGFEIRRKRSSDGAQMERDIRKILGARRKQTEAATLILARMGQGSFRKALLQKWGHKCAVSNISTPEALRASHIKPWADCRPGERLDSDNGLLLSANLDGLFDSGLITFGDDGRMRISGNVSAAEKRALALTSRMKLRVRPSDRQKAFLGYHRDKVYRGD